MKDFILRLKNKIKNGLKNIRQVVKDNEILYDKGLKYNFLFKAIGHFCLRALSPTWWYAYSAKKNSDPVVKMKGIVARNYSYFFLSLLFAVLAGFILNDNSLRKAPSWELFVAAMFVYAISFSRCNEILFSFIGDALDKADGNESTSVLSYKKRIELALISYCELILNYAVIYFFMPLCWFEEPIRTIMDAIYFSGVTITTLGYGDISPVVWLPKILVIHQVFAGFALIIVSFAVYVGKTPKSGSLK